MTMQAGSSTRLQTVVHPLIAVAATFRQHERPEELHFKGCIQIIHPSSGAVRIASDNAIWMLAADRALVLPPHRHHSIQVVAGGALLRMFLPEHLLSDAFCRSGTLQVSPLLGSLMAAGAALPGTYRADSAEARLSGVLLDQLHSAVVRDTGLRLPRDPRARRVVAHLLQSPSASARLDAIARTGGASGRTLTRLFKAETGLGFREFRRQLQVYLAAAHLRAGNTIGDSAFHAGYESQSAFIQAFRRVMGVTPGAYLAQADRQVET